MATVNQNFTVPSGTALSPIVTILSSDGVTPLNLSVLADILFIATINDSIEITKKLSNGSIAFVTDGTNGQIYINFTSTDFPDLTGVFAYQMFIVDEADNISEVITSSSVTVSTSFRGATT